MSFDPPTELPMTAFGELSVAENTPVVQITTPYGQLSQTESFVLNLGNTGSLNSKFFAGSGAAANSIGGLVSKRSVIYKAGQGAKGRFSARFDTPAVGNNHDAGLFGTSDSLSFGFNDLDFGIFHRAHAKPEVQILTVTTPAGGSENATVTVNGVGYTVPLTAGTASHNAYEIAVSLTSQVDLWEFDSQADTVVAIQVQAFGGVGAFAFSSSTAVGSWVQAAAVEVGTITFIKQADWSESYDFTITPSKLTPYEISFEYLGAGGIEFYAENPQTAQFELVHRIMYAGTSDDVSLTNPSFRLGWISENTTNTSNITVEGGSAAGFIEGKKVNVSDSHAAVHTQIGVTTAKNIMTIKNRAEFGGLRSLAEIEVAITSASSDSSKSVTLTLTRNAIPATSFTYTYEDKDESIALIATDDVAISGGSVIAAGVLGSLSLDKLNQTLAPGETITLSMKVASGTASEMTASLNWIEDQ